MQSYINMAWKMSCFVASIYSVAMVGDVIAPVGYLHVKEEFVLFLFYVGISVLVASAVICL